MSCSLLVTQRLSRLQVRVVDVFGWQTSQLQVVSCMFTFKRGMIYHMCGRCGNRSFSWGLPTVKYFTFFPCCVWVWLIGRLQGSSQPLHGCFLELFSLAFWGALIVVLLRKYVNQLVFSLRPALYNLIMNLIIIIITIINQPMQFSKRRL